MLRIAGMGALAAGSARLLGSSQARGQDPVIPRRIVFFYVQSGSMPGRWDPVITPGASSTTETEWSVNPDLMSDLAPYRDDLCFFENLDMVSAFHDRSAAGNSHIDGGTHAMTGAFRTAANEVGGPSIDQHIAHALRESGVLTPFPSLEIGYGFSHESHVSTDGPGGRLPRTQDARQIYQRLFPAPPPGTEAEAEAAARRQALRRERVFGFVRDRFNALSPRLSGPERAKMDQHLASVEDLRRRLELRGASSTMRPPETILSEWDAATNGAARYDASIDAQIIMGAAALHADLTRVITFEVYDAPNEEIGYTPGQWSTSDQHDLIHKVMSNDDPLRNNTDAVDVIRRQHGVAMQRMRRLIDELAARTESDGSRLLDHTVVLYCSQIADGSHNLQGLPWFTVGSCGGRIRTGRYYRQPRNRPNPGYRWVASRWPQLGRAHNDLFITLAQAMGLETTVFGEPSVCTGPIPGMLV
jgi:hypothetical protein